MTLLCQIAASTSPSTLVLVDTATNKSGDDADRGKLQPTYPLEPKASKSSTPFAHGQLSPRCMTAESGYVAFWWV